MHMFESAPQDKIAIAYELKKTNGEHVYLILVYAVGTRKF